MRRAATARYAGARQRDDSRWTLSYRIDGLRHEVHVVYHQPPLLDRDTWSLCLDELALACLVDVSTATMARRAVGPGVGRYGREMLAACTEALRVEALYAMNRPLEHVGMRLDLRARRSACDAPSANGKAAAPRSARGRALPRPKPDRVLLLMGGGKDSLYCYWLLRAAGYDVQCFYLTEARRTWQQLRRVWQALDADTVQHRAFLDVNRRAPLERAFGRWYRSQFQIGQVIAAALPYALAHGCRFLALGLERSSDLPMAEYGGHPVNHQHQKSTAFIELLNRHLADRFDHRVSVVSPLKGLYDLGIYTRFLERAAHLVSLQSSCGGSNSRSPHCGRCPKCSFLAALLLGLSPDRSLYRRLFPRDPLRDEGPLQPWIRDDGARPLTCAGLKEEVRVGMDLAALRGRAPAWYRPTAAHDAAQLAAALDRFTRNHPNRLMPPDMGRRLAPHLAYEPRRAPGLPL